MQIPSVVFANNDAICRVSIQSRCVIFAYTGAVYHSTHLYAGTNSFIAMIRFQAPASSSETQTSSRSSSTQRASSPTLARTRGKRRLWVLAPLTAAV